MKYRGNRPKHGELVAEHESWELWRLTDSRDPDWMNLKLVLGKGMAAKANYWLGYSIRERRFSNTVDPQRLQYDEPELFAFVCGWLAQYIEAAA